MPTPLERRINAGDPRPEDCQWLAFLDMVFRDVPLGGFTDHGMPHEMARRLVCLISLSRRFNQQSDQ
jgi:hypothetical protein